MTTEQPETSRTGRARRFDAGTPRPTERDAAALSWVVEMGGMPLDLLRLAAGGMSDPAVRKMVRRWRIAGWVQTRKLDAGPIWVWATREGVEAFGLRSYDVRVPSVARLSHLREVIVVRLWFGLKLAGQEWRWVSERELRWDLAAALKSSAARAHVVDGVVEYVSQSGQPRRGAVEVELSPKAIDVLKANMRAGADTHDDAFWFVNDRTRALVERAKEQPVGTMARVQILQLEDIHKRVTEGQEETP